ncbi:MAG: hypothetical protein IJF46_05465 [Bacteroidaceae bacterium]|nr:hypothetical protein [Bacteroidaceae bacterium]MBR3855253.1 hypothetical protein [Bacteroidaceae bacterium]
MKTTQIKELRYHWHCNSWNIGGRDDDTSYDGTIKAIVGECEPIEGFPRLRIESIDESEITISFIGERQKLTPGSVIQFNNRVDGHEDHDGVLWNGDNYSLRIYWDR